MSIRVRSKKDRIEKLEAELAERLRTHTCQRSEKKKQGITQFMPSVARIRGSSETVWLRDSGSASGN